MHQLAGNYKKKTSESVHITFSYDKKKSIQPSMPHTENNYTKAEIFLDKMISNYIWMMGVHVCLEDKK